MKGAGILIIEQNYKSRITNRREPSIILFGCPRKNYQDLGGRTNYKDKINRHGMKTRNINKILAKTASREASEESNGLIKLPYRKIMHLPYIDIHKYRCFLLVIQPGIFYSNYFYHNQNYIQNREIEHVSRFFISDLVSNSVKYKNHIICPNANGNPQIIRDRTVGILKRVLGQMIYNIIDYPVDTYVKFSGNIYYLL